MKQVALVTCSQWPDLTNDDQLLVGPLLRHGYETVATPWDDPSIDWSSFEICLIRSSWNYHYHFEEFLNWLKKIEKSHINLWNKVSTIRWNCQKSYLLDLEKKGVSTVPTILVEKNKEPDLLKISRWNCDELIVKPTVGASAYQIKKIKKNQLNKIPKDQDLLIQPLMKEIKEGEYSFIFFNKQYSHAVLKKPSKKEFRVQKSFGGSSELIEPDQRLIDQAQEIVNKVEDDLLYTRLDAINLNGQLCLMELELIEPALFLNSDPSSVEKFVSAILQHLP